MKPEEAPCEAVQNVIEGIHSWYGVQANLRAHTNHYAEVEVEIKHMDSEDVAGITYELVESGWDLQEIDIYRQFLTAQGSVDDLPDYWTK